MSKVIAARKFNFLATDNDPFSVINKLIYPVPVRDRFGILNKYSPFNWSNEVDEIPTAFSETVALGTIIDECMADILSKPPSGKIVISWSGGVDSTALVCAYLQSGADLDRLVIVCTEESIEEYPFFHELMKKQGVEIVVTDSVTEELSIIDCELILTGWCADSLFGYDLHGDHPRWFNEPWLEALSEYALEQHKMKFSAKSLEVIKAVYTDYAEKLGFKIEQWCEFLWLLGFGCTWSYNPHETNLSLVGSDNYGKALAFYSDIKFQRWAVTRFPKLRERNPRVASDYKKPLKQYILNYTGDKTYFNNKTKQATRVLKREEFDFVSVLTEDGVKKFRSVENRDCMGCVYKTVGNKFRKQPV